MLSCDIYCSIKKNNALHALRKRIIDKQIADRDTDLKKLIEYEPAQTFPLKLGLTDHIKTFFSRNFLIGLVILFLLFISSPIFISFSYNDICGKKSIHACKAHLAFGFNKKLADDKQATKIDIKLYVGSAKIYRLQLNYGGCVVYREQERNSLNNRGFFQEQGLFAKYINHDRFAVDYDKDFMAQPFVCVKFDNQPLSESIKFLSEIKNKPIQTLNPTHEMMSIYTSCKNTDIHNITLWVEYKGRLEKIEHDF